MFINTLFLFTQSSLQRIFHSIKIRCNFVVMAKYLLDFVIGLYSQNFRTFFQEHSHQFNYLVLWFSTTIGCPQNQLVIWNSLAFLQLIVAIDDCRKELKKFNVSLVMKYLNYVHVFQKSPSRWWDGL